MPLQLFLDHDDALGSSYADLESTRVGITELPSCHKCKLGRDVSDAICKGVPISLDVFDSEGHLVGVHHTDMLTGRETLTSACEFLEHVDFL